MRIGKTELKSAIVEVPLYLVKQRGDRRRRVSPGDVYLFAGIAAHDTQLLRRVFLFSKFEAKRHALLKVREEAVARAHMELGVYVDETSAKRLVERRLEFGGLRHQLFVDLLVARRDGDDDRLDGGDARRQHEAVVIRVGHDDRPDEAR